MSAPSLVVSCASPGLGSDDELEQWLAKTLAALGPGQASVYRAFCEYPVRTDETAAGDGSDQGHSHEVRPEIERHWLVAIAGHAASDSSQMASLLTEMRLLGLTPTVFRPACAPSTDLGLAAVF